MEIKKSKRIDKIVSLVDEKVDNVYDIACDHGYIGISLIYKRKTNKVIFSDISEGPLNSCKRNVKQFIFDNNYFQEDIDKLHIEYRLGDGLKVIDKNEYCDTVIIAGIGYDLMVKILEDINEYNIKKLILSVQTKVSSFRKYLAEKKFNVVSDDMIIDGGKFYYIQKIILK